MICFAVENLLHLEHLAWLMCTNNLSKPCKSEEISSNINLSE